MSHHNQAVAILRHQQNITQQTLGVLKDKEAELLESLEANRGAQNEQEQILTDIQQMLETVAPE